MPHLVRLDDKDYVRAKGAFTGVMPKFHLNTMIFLNNKIL
jgi:hypothetical protein